MLSVQVNPKDYYAARACTVAFAGAALLSFLYVVITGTYNGDFYGVAQTLGFFGQTVILFLCVLPYLFGWKLYKFFKFRPQARTIAVPTGRLTVVFFAVVLWFIVLAVKYDVGVLGQPIYEAPALIKVLIQISNRLNPYYLGVLFILLHRGSRKVLWLGIVLLIMLGILRAGLGVFIYIFMALLVREYAAITKYAKTHRVKIAIVVLLFPTAVSQLYGLRATLRHEETSEVVMTATEIVLARFVGRLSSYSDTALTIQETNLFHAEIHRLDPLYFAQQGFGGIFGVAFIPDVTPERLLINVYGGDLRDVSFMVGMPGNLYLAAMLSPAVFLLNLALIVFMSLLIFFFARKLRVPVANEFALVLLLYPLTSGVGNEFSSVIAALISFCLLFAILAVPVLPGRGGRIVDHRMK